MHKERLTRLKKPAFPRMNLKPTRSIKVAILLSLLGAFAAILQGCASGGANISVGPVEITAPSSLPSAQIGTFYSATLTVAGGSSPYTWSVSAGTLPAGLTLSTAGVFSGTPTTAGPASFTVKVTDAAAQTSTAAMQISIAPAPLQITTSSPLPGGQVTVAYSVTLTATGGTSPYAWSVSAGTLPAGLTLSTAGVLSGTPTTSGPASFTVKVTDAAAQTSTAAMQISIGLAISLSPIRGGIAVGQQLPLTATVANDIGTSGVSWTVSSGGTLSGQTITTAIFSSASAGVYTITATSKADNTKTASATIGVTNLTGVFTFHNDLARDGSNLNEYALTTSTVAPATFGKLFSCPVDGAIYTQPLWFANVTIGGTKHNVVFVATQHESLYAFDADASPCVLLWQASLIDSNHGGTPGETSVPSGPTGGLVGAGTGDITPEVGVTGTPVIDPSTNTLYVVSKSVIPSGSPTFFQRLHAIDVLTGNEKYAGPVTIGGTYPGTGDGGSITTFDPRQQNQRAGLTLVNGVVYIVWASHEDRSPYYGWVMGYNATTLAQTAILNVTPNVGYGGIWMGGGAPAADSSNNLYFITGNGIFDANNAAAPNNDYGDSFLKITSGLTVSDYATPSDQDQDNATDSDFGSGGAAMLLDQPLSPAPHLVIGGGKDWYLYLVNRDAMGGYGDANAWQRINFGSQIFATGAFWNGQFYLAAVNAQLQNIAFDSTSGKFNLSTIVRSPNSFPFPGSTPSVSSSGTTNGIVWALDNGSYCTLQTTAGCGPAVLHAYDATNIAIELWNSTMGTGNMAGNAVKFTVPTVANGKVYVGTRGNNTGGNTSSSSVPGELDVYGLLPN